MNFFEALAEAQIAAPVKARHRAAERRAETRASKADEDRGGLLKEWHAWRRQQVEDALAGPHGAAIAALLARPSTLALGEEINAADFVRTGDRDTQYLATRLISARVIELREAAGIAPFDDPLRF